jgi:hypothetical protein
VQKKPSRPSSEESQESLPHDQTAKDSVRTTALRPEPHGQSSQASLSDSAPSLEPEASLQITALPGTGGISTGLQQIFLCAYLRC